MIFLKGNILQKRTIKEPVNQTSIPKIKAKAIRLIKQEAIIILTLAIILSLIIIRAVTSIMMLVMIPIELIIQTIMHLKVGIIFQNKLCAVIEVLQQVKASVDNTLQKANRVLLHTQLFRANLQIQSRTIELLLLLAHHTFQPMTTV